MSAWSADEMQLFGEAEELHIAAVRADGTRGGAVPIWVVPFDGQVYVRTWYRRDTGWFGQVVGARRAEILVPGLRAVVTVEDVGDGSPALRAGVDAAYRDKYGRYGRATVDRMVADPAAASTLQLLAER